MTILSCEELVKQKRNLISSVRRLFSKCPWNIIVILPRYIIIIKIIIIIIIIIIKRIIIIIIKIIIIIIIKRYKIQYTYITEVEKALIYILSNSQWTKYE